MEIRIGPPVTANNFYPRPELIKKLVSALEGAHVAFLGPRRTGKTSCLKAIEANPPIGYLPIFLDLEKHETVLAWLNDMAGEIQRKIEQPIQLAASMYADRAELSKRIAHVRSVAGKKQEWRPVAEAFLEFLKQPGAQFMFLLDEFPLFLIHVEKNAGRKEVEAALHWFRAARQELVDCAPRFLLTGSVGLHAVVRGFGLSPSINDLDS